MGLLAALKAIGAQLLGFKFLFTIFQERTRAYYLHQGLTLGSAQYIATGRGYTMSSNFVKLFSWYARSHPKPYPHPDPDPDPDPSPSPSPSPNPST